MNEEKFFNYTYFKVRDDMYDKALLRVHGVSIISQYDLLLKYCEDDTVQFRTKLNLSEGYMMAAFDEYDAKEIEVLVTAKGDAAERLKVAYEREQLKDTSKLGMLLVCEKIDKTYCAELVNWNFISYITSEQNGVGIRKIGSNLIGSKIVYFKKIKFLKLYTDDKKQYSFISSKHDVSGVNVMFKTNMFMNTQTIHDLLGLVDLPEGKHELTIKATNKNAKRIINLEESNDFFKYNISGDVQIYYENGEIKGKLINLLSEKPRIISGRIQRNSEITDIIKRVNTIIDSAENYIDTISPITDDIINLYSTIAVINYLKGKKKFERALEIANKLYDDIAKYGYDEIDYNNME